MGFTVNNHDNYYATADYLPDGESKPSLAVLCHLDVVPAGKGWTYDPFKVTEKDGILYGEVLPTIKDLRYPHFTLCTA